MFSQIILPLFWWNLVCQRMTSNEQTSFGPKNIPFQESLGCQPLVCKSSQNCAAAQISGGKVQVRRPRSPSSRNNKTKIARLMGDAWLEGNEKVGCWEKRRKIKMDSREEEGRRGNDRTFSSQRRNRLQAPVEGRTGRGSQKGESLEMSQS